MEEPSVMRQRTHGKTALCCNLTSTMELQCCDVTTKRLQELFIGQVHLVSTNIMDDST